MEDEYVSSHFTPGLSGILCLQRLFGIVSLEFSANLAVSDGFFDLAAHAHPKYNMSGFPQTGLDSHWLEWICDRISSLNTLDMMTLWLLKNTPLYTESLLR